MFACFFICLTNTMLFAQLPYVKSNYSFGASANFLIISHIIDFNNLPEVESCCPHYSDANGSGLSFGLFAERRIDAFSYISLALSYVHLNADLSSPEFKWIVINDQPALAEINHKLTSSLSYLSVEPGYKYSTPIGLTFGAALDLNFLLSTKYNQSEILVKPENEGTFENGKRIRYELSGNIKETSVLMALLNFYAEFYFKLDNFNLYSIGPKISYSYGLNSLFSDRKWRISYFSLGLQFKYNPFSEVSSPLEPK